MKYRKSMIGGAVALTLVSGLAWAHGDDDGRGQLGKVNFSNSCSASVQPQLMRGVAMLHSFWYSAAEQTFREVLVSDPTCAIANWGIAAILMSNPLAGTGASPKGAQQAQEAIEQARKTPARTQRENDYIEAVAAYYQDWGNRPERSRQASRAKAFEALAEKYPGDDEAQIFSALYTAGTQSQADQTYAAYRKAAAALEKQFVKYPDHPGVAHYLIHSYDAPPIAAQGLNAARRYASIAPSAPHAQHMPSHIFTRVGEWEASVATNLKSFASAMQGGEPDDAYHASDYAVYAYLQLARDGAALSTLQTSVKVQGATPGRPVAPYAVAAMKARYAVERGDWRAAAQLEPAGGKIAFTEAITWFAKALGAARSGDVPAAEQSAAQLATLHKTLEESKNAYWATEVEVQRLAAAGWIALARSNTDEALKLMRAAADLEDRNEKHIITPGRILPARELLGDMLMQTGQAALALRAYEQSQEREPNRFRGLYGAAQAAQAVGDRAKARLYFGKLVALTKNADSPRPELNQAKTYLAQQ